VHLLDATPGDRQRLPTCQGSRSTKTFRWIQANGSSPTAAATANEVGDDPTALSARQRLAPLLTSIQDPYLQALCQLAMAWISPVGDFDGALRAASVSLEQLRGQDEPFWTALAVVTLGSVRRPWAATTTPCTICARRAT
jgi:soluble lytic murein transglycosylase-like protein